MVSKWPTALRLEIIETGMSILKFQALIQDNKAAVARVQCRPEMDNHNLDELIETLRKGKCVSRHDSGQSLSLTSQLPVLGGRPRSRTKALKSWVLFCHHFSSVYFVLYYPPLNSRRRLYSTRTRDRAASRLQPSDRYSARKRGVVAGRRSLWSPDKWHRGC